MGENTDGKNISGRKSGKIKRICGWLFVLMLLVVFSVSFLLYRWSDWDREATPWPMLPPDTKWALHIHDAAAMGKAALRDKGMRALLAAQPGQSERRNPAEEATAYISSNMITLYKYLGFLHTAAAPNVVVSGATFRDPGAVFAIVQPPAWMRFFLQREADTYRAIQVTDWFGDSGVFYVERDGWLIVSQTREAVQEVLDGWDAKAMPLGAGSKRNDAHAYFAVRETSAKAAATTVAAPVLEAPASHFTLGDPFAAAAPVAPRSEKVKASPSGRLLVRPGEGEWLVWGEGAESGALAGGGELAGVVEAIGVTAPDVRLASGRDVGMFAVMDEEVRARVGEYSAKMIPEKRPFGENPVVSLAGKWLREDWLARAGNGWVVMAGAPAVEQGELPYPVLPVLTLGWRVGEGNARIGTKGTGGAADEELVASARAFGSGLERLIESIRTMEGGWPVQRLRTLVDAQWDGRSEGRVMLPEVAVNGARLAWRFAEQDGIGMGWVSTDPSGVPGCGGGEVGMLKKVREPGEGHMCVVGGWNVSAGFVRGVLGWVEDRVDMLRNAGVLEREAGKVGVDVFEKVMVGFPKGSFGVDFAVEGGRCVLYARVLQRR